MLTAPRGVALMVLLVISGACAGEVAREDDGADGGLGDDFAGGWTPRPLTAPRFTVFYQISDAAVEALADLPSSPQHAYVFAHSHPSAPAHLESAKAIHKVRRDFLYAPCFDLGEHPGWTTASDDKLAAMAHQFRDTLLAAHADLFCLNETPTNTPTDADTRVRVAKLLRYLNDPAPGGARLQGVLFMTEHSANPGNWTQPGDVFWQAVDDTCAAVVAEHFHGYGFVCANQKSYLADHYFALRRWLADSGNPAKRSIAVNKFVVFHSARYSPDQDSGWAGASSVITPFDAFERDLARAAQITRATEGGFNRIGFGPISTSITDSRVEKTLSRLIQWHYGADQASADEAHCLDGQPSNCQCN